MSDSLPPPEAPGPAAAPLAPTVAVAKKKSKVVMAIVVAAALVVISGVVITAMTLLRKPASIPAAKVLPADTVAVVNFDLNPSAENQKAVGEFADRFSDIDNFLPEKSSSYKQTAWEFAVEGRYLVPSWEEVEDWVGDNVALASGYWTPEEEDHYGYTSNVAAIQYKDTKKAEEAIAEWIRETELSYLFLDDYVLIADNGVKLDGDRIRKERLSEAKGFQDRLGKLSSGPYLATAWVASQGWPENPFGFKRETDTSPGDIPSTSEVALGLRMSGDDVQLDAVTWQEAKFEGKPTGVDDLVGGLPDDASGALGFSVSDSMLESLDDSVFALPEDRYGYDPFSGARETLRELGLSSGSDFRDLIGEKTALYFPKHFPDDAWTYAATYDYEDLKFGMVAKPKDAKKYESTWEDLLTSRALYLEDDVKRETEGDKVYSGWGISPSEMQKVSKKLADTEVYKQVVKDAGDAHLIAFVNGSAIKSFYSYDERRRRMAKEVVGAGVVGRQLDDHYGQFTLRVGMKKK